MNAEDKDHDSADDWHDFLENLEAGYRRQDSLERELNAITEQANALRKELTRTASEVMSREAFMEQCRAKGEHVPNVKRPRGTA